MRYFERIATPRQVRGAKLIELEVLQDHRGYSGRMFRAGSRVKRTAGVARKLIAMGKARRVSEPAPPVVPKKFEPPRPPDPKWAHLRGLDKEELKGMCVEMGIPVDGRWGKDRLIEAIEDHG